MLPDLVSVPYLTALVYSSRSTTKTLEAVLEVKVNSPSLIDNIVCQSEPLKSVVSIDVETVVFNESPLSKPIFVMAYSVPSTVKVSPALSPPIITEEPLALTVIVPEVALIVSSVDTPEFVLRVVTSASVRLIVPLVKIAVSSATATVKVLCALNGLSFIVYLVPVAVVLTVVSSAVVKFLTVVPSLIAVRFESPSPEVVSSSV